MTERAIVVAVDAQGVTVRCGASEACSSCGSLLCPPRERTYRARVNSDLPVAPGDAVEVEVPERGAATKALLLFGLPIILFAATYIALGGVASETQRVALGLGGLGAGFGIAMLVSSRLREPEPAVVQIYRNPSPMPIGRVPPADVNGPTEPERTSQANRPQAR